MNTTFVVPTRRWESEFQQRHIASVVAASSIIEVLIPTRMPWHFVVLDDLGIEEFDDYNSWPVSSVSRVQSWLILGKKP